MVFVFIWATVVYDPVAYWTWNANGWGYQWGILDFAGQSDASFVERSLLF